MYADTIHHHAAPKEDPFHDVFLPERQECMYGCEHSGRPPSNAATEGHLLTFRRPLLRYSVDRLCGSKDSRRLLRRLPGITDVPKAIDTSTVAFTDDLRVVNPVEVLKNASPNQEAHRILDHAVAEARHPSVPSRPKITNRTLLFPNKLKP